MATLENINAAMQLLPASFYLGKRSSLEALTNNKDGYMFKVSGVVILNGTELSLENYYVSVDGIVRALVRHASVMQDTNIEELVQVGTQVLDLLNVETVMYCLEKGLVFTTKNN
jgi:hypothetical protein